MLQKFAYFLCATVLSGTAFAADRHLLAQATSDAPAVTSAGNPGMPKAAAKPAAASRAEVVTLDEAVGEAVAASPRLKASQAAVAATRGERRQAGALPNPEVSYSKENFRAGSAYKAISPAQSVYGVTQLVEVGGKISAREHVADEGVRIAGLEARAAALDLVRDVTVAYADAVAAEEGVRLAAEQKALAEDVLASVTTRVDAAASPLIQRSRAEVERSAAAVALDSAKRDRVIARKTLASLMGRDEASFPLDKKAFFALPKRKVSADSVGLKNNPDVLRLGAALEQSKARLELERANAVPDLRVSAGLVQIPSAKDKALVVGVSLPIPVFNANRGGIDRARGEVSKAEQDGHAAQIALDADLTRAEQRMENAYAQASALKTEILPAAQRAFALAREGYGLGRFPYLEVLDAQRSLSAARQQQIEALRNYHTARAVLDRLTAARPAPAGGPSSTHQTP